MFFCHILLLEYSYRVSRESNLTKDVGLPSELNITKSERGKEDKDPCKREYKMIEHGFALLLSQEDICILFSSKILWLW